MGRRIRVAVGLDGTITAVTEGVKGPACLDEVARIEALTGAATLSSQLTAEYQETATTTVAATEEIHDGDVR